MTSLKVCGRGEAEEIALRRHLSVPPRIHRAGAHGREGAGRVLGVTLQHERAARLVVGAETRDALRRRKHDAPAGEIRARRRWHSPSRRRCR